VPLDRFTIPVLTLLVPLVLVSGTPAAPAPSRARPPVGTGRIDGTVVISRSLTAHRPRFRLYAGDGAAALPPDRPVEDQRHNVVVYLDGSVTSAAGDDASPTAPRAAMRQVDEQFTPHVLPVRRGTNVDFPNGDGVFHNVFSLSSPRVFDLGRYPRGSSRSRLFDRPGVVQVFCHIHADMSAVVLVLENTYFTQPDSTGRFALVDVPPGEYRIVAWHERIRPIAHTIRVEAGKTTTVDFNIPLPAGEGRER
jgi:plastocyanin